jgi:vacuolar-type H+-ATPase subunit H
MTSMERIVQAVRQNPEGLLLLGAGVALVMRSAIAPTGAKASVARSAPHFGPQTPSQPLDRASIGKSLREGVSDMQDAVVGAAQDLGEKASDMSQAAADRAKRVADDASSSVADIVEAQPMAVAIAGIAVGCLAAAFLPTSRLETDTLRPLGNQAVDALSNAKDRVKEATFKAGEQLKDAAADRGLNKQGLSEVARDVASDFKSNVIGKPESKASTPESPSYGR